MKDKELNQDYDYSELHIHFNETIYKQKDIEEKDVKFRKLFHNVILDSTLTTNDIAMYLSILKENYYLNKNRWYSQKRLSKTTKIAQPNISNHVKQLESKGYIGYKRGFKSSYSVKSQGSKFYPLTSEHLEGLSVNKKLFIDMLRLLILSSGNDKLPPIKTCKKRFTKLSYRYYNEIKELRQGRTDIELYESLKDLSLLQTNNKATSSSKDVELKVSLKDRVSEVFEFLNKQCRKYGHDEFKSQDHMKITTTILGLYEVDEVKEVIANRFNRWNGDINMNQNLKPKTMFKPHLFKEYLKDFQDTDKGQELVNYSNLKIENGEEIDYLNVTQFVDKQTYNLKKFLTDKEGNKRGSSSKICRYGKDIRKMINVQDSNEKYNGVREYLYYYDEIV